VDEDHPPDPDQVAKAPRKSEARGWSVGKDEGHRRQANPKAVNQTLPNKKLETAKGRRPGLPSPGPFLATLPL